MRATGRFPRSRSKHVFRSCRDVVNVREPQESTGVPRRSVVVQVRPADPVDPSRIAAQSLAVQQGLSVIRICGRHVGLAYVLEGRSPG